jgi:hypothetical protein
MENPNFNQEKKESFQPIELKIDDTDPTKKPMLVFHSKTIGSSAVYNVAISSVLTNHELNPIHVIAYQDQDPDQSGWEVQETISKEEMEKLLPEIHAKAKEYSQFFFKDGV